MTIDRFGSILAVVDLDIKGTPIRIPDYNRGVQIFNQFNGYAIEAPELVRQRPRWPERPASRRIASALPIFAAEQGYAIGDMGTIGIDTFFPFNRTDLQYTYYTGITTCCATSWAWRS